jgi:hypothetical protein
MPTLNFDCTDNNDGWGVYTDTVWPANGGTFTDGDTFDSTIILLSKRNTFEDGWGLMRWDTSSLPDGATITAADLILYAVSRSEFGGDNYGVVGDYYDFGGEPVVPADYIETASPSIFTVVDMGTFTLSATNTIPLTNLTGISKVGFTGIRLTLNAGTPTQSNIMSFASSEHATGNTPRLSVTYTEPADALRETTMRHSRGGAW